MPSPEWSEFLDGLLAQGGLAALLFARAAGCFVLLPFFPQSLLQGRVRLALPIAMLPLLLAGGAAAGWPAPPLSWLLVPRAAIEFCIGVVVALPACALFWAARAAGEMVDIQTGANNQEMFTAITDGMDGPGAQLFVQLALLGFLTSGGLQELVAALWASYGAVRPGGAGGVDTSLLPALARQLIGMVSTLALKVCMPLVAAFLLIEAVLAMAARAMQQLPLPAIAAAVKSLLLPLALILVMQLFSDYLRPPPMPALDLPSLFPVRPAR